MAIARRTWGYLARLVVPNRTIIMPDGSDIFPAHHQQTLHVSITLTSSYNQGWATSTTTIDGYLKSF
ncbi:hypothetical protein ACFX1Q_030539 [Malus domestica]